MNKIWLCLSILALAAGSALANPETTDKVITESENDNVETLFILPDAQTTDNNPVKPQSEDLIPFAERYRRSLLRGTTLNNPALRDWQPLETNPQP